MSKNRETQRDSEQDNPNQEGISSSRRQFTKTGLLASPVLMSVMSRPVFGVGCLSNVLSGNLSDPERGQCNLGLKPSYWRNHPEVWRIATGVKEDGASPTSCDQCLTGDVGSETWKCTGGALFNSYFTLGPQDAHNRSMYELLCTKPHGDKSRIITALLNAMTDSNYVLSVDQVLQLWADPTIVAPATLKDFLNSTW